MGWGFTSCYNVDCDSKTNNDMVEFFTLMLRFINSWFITRLPPSKREKCEFFGASNRCNLYKWIQKTEKSRKKNINIYLLLLCYIYVVN